MRDSPTTASTWSPHWQPAKASRPAMSPAWWAWVASCDSLTARLISAADQRDFRVCLLDQRVARPRHDEALALGLPLGRHAWLREVALCVAERPWVVARSVAPLSRLRGQRLDRLGENSLGSWLFRQPDLERGPIEITRHQAPFYPAPGPWGRRSVFRHGRFAVLVQEFFLDAMRDELALPAS
ncbi:putative chorismate pyruvate-lyase [Litchfieldella qijiaojingensis]|uniref:Probable chorismate pyruvate-lyase n=1 Tax=Litchfieldella qijiaojingensis TaxID=980347 RepID=A0ABQ2Z4P3_9GAMM|nr:putative chorismate pyruvate-lyase [Halomonas qijiaojingensis]